MSFKGKYKYHNILIFTKIFKSFKAISIMKNLIYIASIILLTSCATDKYLLSPSEMAASEYKTEGYKIFKGDQLVGKVTSTEIEIDTKGNVVKEVSITLEGFSNSNDAESIMKFLHTKYPNKKIEINLDGVESFE